MMKRKKRNVKRLIFAAMLLVFCVNMANSQVLLALLFGDKLSTEKFQMGIPIDLTWSNFQGADGTKMRLDWSFGLFFEIKLSDRLSLQPEFIIKTPAGSKEFPSAVPEDPGIEDLIEEYSVTRQLTYITLPIHVKYRFNAFRIGVGPRFGYLNKAKDRYIGTTINGNSITVEEDIKDRLNQWDAGVIFSLEYLLQPENNMRSARITLKYYQGLVDIIKDNPGDSVKNWAITLGVGIAVGGGDKDKPEEK